MSMVTKEMYFLLNEEGKSEWKGKKGTYALNASVLFHAFEVHILHMLFLN